MPTFSLAKRPAHESFTVGVLLALVGGMLDAHTFLFRGGVFANAQTGNIVLLGVNIARLDGENALYYLCPIAAFFVGVLVTEWVRARFSVRQLLRWEHIVLVLEMTILLAAGLLPSSAPDWIVNVSVSFVCSLQVNAFRKLRGAGYATTMCTGNLRSAAENFFRLVRESDREAGRRFLRYIGIICAFLAGALAGALLTGVIEQFVLFVCCGLLAAVFVILLLRHE